MRRAGLLSFQNSLLVSEWLANLVSGCKCAKEVDHRSRRSRAVGRKSPRAALEGFWELGWEMR